MRTRLLPIALPCLVVAMALTPMIAAQGASLDQVRADVEYLAAPDLQGRLTGTPGAAMAADYLVQRLTELGAVPMTGAEGLLDPFDFVAGSRDLGSSLARGEVSFGGPQKVAALAFSESAEVSAPVVFAGYGLKVPDGQDYPYDSYAGLDVEGKIVLVLRYFPEDAEPEAKRIMARYSGLRYKALQAREAGAVGMLVVAGPNSPNAGKTVTESTDAAIQGSGIVAATVSADVGEWLFSASDTDLAQAQTALDSGNPHVAGFDLGADPVTLTTRVERVQSQGRNVVGVLPASAATTYPGAIVFGAHFDHLGAGDNASSLADSDERDAVHVGADDNASGVAAVLALARRWTEQARTRDVILAFWSGEELGLLGSQAFVAELNDKAGAGGEPPVVAYLNFDMVGRLREHRMTLQAVGSSPAWSGWIEAANVPVGLTLTLQQDPYLPTDSTAFHNAGIPSLNFFTGSHADYHKPSDLPSRLNYEGINTVVELAFGISRRLMAAEAGPEFVQVERAEAPGGRDGVRAYTGTIPDYASDATGLRLSGVMGGGPAEAAGLQEGDVIVEFGGQEIRNIYDYTYALDAIVIGEEVPVVYERDGERHETAIVPTARE